MKLIYSLARRGNNRRGTPAVCPDQTCGSQQGATKVAGNGDQRIAQVLAFDHLEDWAPGRSTGFTRVTKADDFS